MGKVQRKRYDATFKSKVVLEALKEQKTLAQLSAEYGIHATQISTWKQQVLTGLPTLLGSSHSPKKEENHEAITAPLYQQIGELKVENDYLKKKLRTLYK